MSTRKHTAINALSILLLALVTFVRPQQVHAAGQDCMFVYYAHTLGLVDGLTVGSVVQKGQVIGRSGNTGYGDGWTAQKPETVPHLHFACSTEDPRTQEATHDFSWMDPNPSLHAAWGNPLSYMNETGVAFGEFNSSGGQDKHTGRDYEAALNTPLYAIADGTIVWAGWWPEQSAANKSGHGITIVLQIGPGPMPADIPIIIAPASQNEVSNTIPIALTYTSSATRSPQTDLLVGILLVGGVVAVFKKKEIGYLAIIVALFYFLSG